MERRPENMQAGADGDADVDVYAAEEANLDAEACADGDADADVVVEGVPGKQEVTVGGKPDLQPVRPVGGFHAGAGHDAGIGEGEVGLALDVDDAEEGPVIAEARNIGVFRLLVECGVVAAHSKQELRAREPHEVGEAAGELTVRTEEVGVAGELCLDGEETLGGTEANFKRELDGDERGVVAGQRHACDAEDSNFETAIERDIDDGGDVDDDEGGAAESGGEPEAAAAGGNLVADVEQRAHRVVGDFVGFVKSFDEEERGDLVDVVGDDELAVVADAEAEP